MLLPYVNGIYTKQLGIPFENRDIYPLKQGYLSQLISFIYTVQTVDLLFVQFIFVQPVFVQS